MDPFITGAGVIISGLSLITTMTNTYLNNRKLSHIKDIRDHYYSVYDKSDLRFSHGEDSFNELTEHLSSVYPIISHVERKLKRDAMIFIPSIIVLTGGYIYSPGGFLVGLGFKHLGYYGIAFLSAILIIPIIQIIKNAYSREIVLINNMLIIEDFLYEKFISIKINEFNKIAEENEVIKSNKIKLKKQDG